MKLLKKSLTLLCALLLLLSLSAPAYATAPVNVIKDSGAPAFGPTADDILATDGGDKVQLPKASSYYSSYVTMYIEAEKGHSVLVHKRPMEVAGEQLLPYAFHGSRVIVLAEEDGLSCILYHDMDNILRAGWVYSDYLTPRYNGRTSSIGSSSSLAGVLYGDPEVKWSREPFVGSKQKYTLLDEPVQRCTGFTLDYHVTARNGASTEEVLGPRNVYVNAGDGWVKVGSFSYDKLGAVHIEVRLDEPMTLAAVATEAECAQPDTFLFRQCLLDVYQTF